MNRKKRIESILRKNFLDWKIEVIDNSFKHKGHNNFDGNQESHFKIILYIDSKKKINKFKVHKKINFLLKNEFLIGLHALQIKINN
jgi:BolA protein